MSSKKKRTLFQYNNLDGCELQHWPTVKLEDVTSVLGDGLHGTPEYDELGEYHFINGNNLVDGSISINDKTKRTSEKEYLKHAKPLNDRTILVSINGTLGNVALYAGEKVILGKSACYFNVLENVDKYFIKYVVSNKDFQSYIHNLATGSTIKNVSLKLMRNYEFKLPSLEQQKAIASVLLALDDKIKLLRETNATLEAIAQALFKSWFVDFDPVHANAAALENKEQAPSLPPEIQALFPATFTDSPQGPIPDGWRWGTIADLAVLNPESWTAKKHPNTVAYIDLANAKDNVIADIAEFEFDAAPSRARRVLRDGDTIVGTVRPGNRSFAFIHGAVNNLTGSTGFAVLRPKHEENTAFTYLAATNDSSIDYLTHIADGGAYPAVKPEVVANLACIVPPVEVLEAFNSVTAELLRKITKHQQQAQVIANLRDTLLPRLISGQMRLPEADQDIAVITD